MAGRFALQHMHPLNLWIQPSPMPQCFLNSHNKALGPAIIVMKASPWKHARETTLFSIHPLNKLQKTIRATMAQKLLSYNYVIISSTPWHKDSYHTTMSSYLPSHIVTDFYHTTMSYLILHFHYHTKKLTTHQCCPILHPMTQDS